MLSTGHDVSNLVCVDWTVKARSHGTTTTATVMDSNRFHCSL